MKLQEPHSQYQYLKSKIIWVGQMTNYYSTRINRKLFQLPSADPIKKLTDDKAIEKGAEFISEILIYSVLLALPILEWKRQSNINKIKDEITERGLARMKKDIELISKENSNIRNDIIYIKEVISIKKKI